MILLVGAANKGRRELRTGGGGFGIRVARGEGNRGAEKVSDVRRGWRVGLWGGGGRKLVGLGKEAGSRACL